MSDHEIFKLKKELVQCRKIIEQQKADLKLKEAKLIEVEVNAELWRDQVQAIEFQMMSLREQLQEKEQIIMQDDPAQKESLRKQLQEKSEALEHELSMQRKLRDDLDAKEALIGEYRMQLREAAIKYKDDTILQDAENYRDEVMANRVKVQALVEKQNQMSQALEHLSAENRVLRKMAGVPDDYNFELEDIIQEGQLQVEKYRAQVRALEGEVEEQQEEITKLRRRLRENAMGGNIEPLDDPVDLETRKHLKKEIEDLKFRNKQLENENYQLKLENTGVNRNSKGEYNNNNNNMDELIQQHTELKNQFAQLIAQLQGNGGTQNIHEPQQTQNIVMHQLSFPPTPIPGAFGNYNDIKEGYSYRFQTKLPVDASESSIDMIQIKYEIASLQLQNLETLHLLQEKEKEYTSLKNENEEVKEDIKKRCLLVQDELFQRYARDRAEWDLKYTKLMQECKDQKEQLSEQKVKLDQYTTFMNEVKSRDSESIVTKLAEMSKRAAILDVNLIRLSRKYECLTEEYNQIKSSFVQQQSDYAEKERDYLEKINKLVEWKRKATAKVTIMLHQLQTSVPSETFHITRQQLEYTSDKLANQLLKEATLITRIASLENAERESFAKSERIRNLEEELTEVQLEGEIIKKRLEALDPAFRSYQQVYVQIVDFIKIRNISPLQMFQMFDVNGDGHISKDEFGEALRSMGIPLNRDDLEVLYMFVDLDGTGVIEYQEFVSKLRRSGVNIRQKEEELLFTLYRAIQEAGLSIRSAFEAFDTNGDRIISKQDMREVLTELRIQFQQEAIDYIFKIADSSGDNQINYDEFQNLFQSIVQNQIQENQRTVLGELDWKMQVMLKIDSSVKEQNLTLLDAFKMIDRNEDNTISLREFQQMFEGMGIGLKEDAIKDLFYTINRRLGQLITYNQLLNYLREAKAEEDKLSKLKIIQEKTKQLQQANHEEAWDRNAVMSLESRLQMKITILEMREKHAITRAGLFIQQLAQQESLIKDINKQIQEVQKQMEKCNENYYKEREERMKLSERLQGSISREESEKLKRSNDQLSLQTEDLKAALNTYRTLYDTAVSQTKVMRLTIEKIRNDHETLQNTIKDLQAASDQNATIGKLYHHVMVSRWNEGQVNQKYDALLDQIRKLKLQEASYEAIMKDRNDELLNSSELFRETFLNCEKQISELKSKILPTVTLARVEEQANRIKELAEMKFEVEKQNRQLREQFYELQLKADYFDVYKSKLQELEQRLRNNHSDELSHQIIDVSEKLSECKMDLLKAQRDLSVAREKEEYYNRLNRQYTDTIKQLEYNISQTDLQLRKREEEWRKKFYEQRKTIFAQLGMSEEDGIMKPKIQDRLETNQQRLQDFLLHQENGTIQPNQSQNTQEGELQFLKIENTQLQNDLKKREIEIEGLQQRLRIQGVGNSQVFSQQQLEQYTKDVISQEAEKLSMAAQQTIRTLQDIIKDKDAQVERKEQQIEQVKKESMMHKKRDTEEIQRLQDLVYAREREKMTEQIKIPALDSVFATQTEPIMIQQFEAKLKDKDNKIKDLQIALEAEKKAIKKIKEDLVKTLDEKESLNQELIIEQKKNESEKYRKQIETLQKLVNSKNKELQSIKGSVTQLKDEVFKVAEDGVKKEQEYNVKEARFSTNNTELEMRLKNLIQEVKTLKQEIKIKHEELERLQIKDIESKAIITELKQQIEKLKTTLLQSGYRMNTRECQQEGDVDQQVTAIQNKLQQINQLQIENATLQKEIQFLKSMGTTKGFFDKEGNLQSLSNQLYFKNIDELFEVLRLYMATKPKISILSELEKIDKNKTRLIPLAKLFDILAIVGVKLKTRDQKLLVDFLKQEKGELCDYYNKFYYKLKKWSDQNTSTTEISQQGQKLAGKI